MGTLTATVQKSVAATPDVVLAALADYVVVRPEILPEQYTDYAVAAGGQGDGTIVSWRLHATKKRVRHVISDVTTDAGSVTETDRSSTLVTVFAVTPEGAGSTVVVTSTWRGAGGIGGFFERRFAPAGLARIHGDLLDRLAARLA